jgi:hypothetical protein
LHIDQLGKKMEFIGCDLDARECALLGLKIDRLHWTDEPGLVRSRWFDYSALRPVQATYLYAHLYKEQTRIFYETYIDARTVQDARAFVPDDIFSSRDMTAMWLARRFADGHGMQYDFVLQFAQARCFERLWSRFPRPNQLYGEEFEVDLVAAWKESLGRSMRLARDDAFKASRHRRGPTQLRYVAFVIDQVKARQKPHTNLLGRLFSQDVLSPALAADLFTEEEIEAAQQVASNLAVSHH